jgi:hypothetical protein
VNNSSKESLEDLLFNFDVFLVQEYLRCIPSGGLAWAKSNLLWVLSVTPKKSYLTLNCIVSIEPANLFILQMLPHFIHVSSS